MPKTRPDGPPLTPDDLEFGTSPTCSRDFRRCSTAGSGRLPGRETLQPEGTTTTPAGITLEHLTVQSAADEAIAATEGWADFTTAISRGTTHPPVPARPAVIK